MARSKGEGTLIKRGKYWTARWVSNGEVHVRSTKCTQKRDAEKKLAEFTKPFRETSELAVLENLAAKMRVIKTEHEDEDLGNPVKIDFLVDTYTSDVSSSPLTSGTEANYNAQVSQFKEFVGYKQEISSC